MRKQRGTVLIEMIVAVGLSGIFVLLLSGMLSQALLLSTSGQNELIAANAAEVLLENARVMGYLELQQSQLGTQLGQPVALVVNYPNASMNYPQLRYLPVQLNLADPLNVFGEVNGLNNSLTSSNQWTSSVGNFFHGAATVVMVDGSAFTLLPSYQITVTISYPGTFASADGKTNTKTLSRSAYVFQNGAKLQ